MHETDDLLFLNDDVEVMTPNFLDLLEGLLEAPRSQSYGLVSLRVVGGVGNEEQAQPLGPEEIRETRRAACFVAVLIRRGCWDQVGPMDERFIGYGEDDCDYTHRAHLAGWKVGITGAASVKHGMDGNPHSSSYNKDGRENKQTRTRWERQSALNVRLFVEKWGSFSWELVK
jgi:GT2 family glycosyltransferase